MILLRHGQSEYNHAMSTTGRDPRIPDPSLTALGERQAEAAALALAANDPPIRRILVSPYRRALQTAAPLAARLGIVPEVTGLLRERCASSCDIGRPRMVVAGEWPQLDFSHLDEIWWPRRAETEAQVMGRAAEFLALAAARADWANTVAVCHWGIALAICGESLDNGTWARVDPTAPHRGEFW